MKVRREALLWLKMAEEDLEDGAEALKRKRWFRTAFYAQQAAEKAFKALFFPVRREDSPHLHTVTELYTLLKEANFNLPEEIEKQLYTLNKYYTVTRYPDAANGLPSESVDEIEAQRAIKIAREVVTHAKKHIEGDS